MAVDFPIFQSVPTGRSAVISSSITSRMPFEAVLDPDVLLSNVGRIYDVETNSQARIESTGSFGAPVNDLYKSAIGNFMTEVPRFFLGGTDGQKGATYGPLTSFVSRATAEEGVPAGGHVETSHIQFEDTKTYKMRIVCSHSKIRNFEAMSGNADRLLQTASYIYNPPTIMMYNRAFNRSSPQDGTYTDLYYGEYYTGGGNVGKRYSGHHAWGQNGACPVYGSSFGTPIHAGLQPASSGQGGHEAHTPPYYHGYSHIELSYTPDFKGYKTISDIVSGLTASYYREPIRKSSIDSGSYSYKAAMQLSASINWRQLVTENNQTRWVIQPKWECPVLDFTRSPITIPTDGSGSVAKGMWHQYGELPSEDSGIFMEIQFPEGTQAGDAVGNLAEKLGFDVWPKRKIGVIPETGKTVSEAIVAIPFFEDFHGKRRFFHLNRKTINWAISKMSENYTTDAEYLAKRIDLTAADAIYKPSDAVINMVKSMYKYSMPPNFNFIMRDDAEPMAMVFFEFNHHFTQDDLVKMWQGVMPSQDRKDAASGRQHAISEIDFGINLSTNFDDLIGPKAPELWAARIENYKGWHLLNDFPGHTTGDFGFPKNIQWMVFKVKQKASANYYSLTADNKDAYGSPTLNYIPTPATYWWLPFFGMWISPLFKMLNSHDKLLEYYRHNWPYDFFSIVELAKIEETIVLEPRVNQPVDAPTIIDILELWPKYKSIPFSPIYDGATRTDRSTLIVPMDDRLASPRQQDLREVIKNSPVGVDFGAMARKYGSSQFVALQVQPAPRMKKTQALAPQAGQQKHGFSKGTQKK
jgi:hypothetical protein